MAARSKSEKVLAFRSPHIQTAERKKEPAKSRQTLHPAARRRRFIWLGIMLFMLSWAVGQLVIQQFRIWDKEEVLAQKKQELAAVKQQTEQLKREVRQLNDTNYLLELAHKLGYIKPGEQNYQEHHE
ncbi:FtsB family cell division protein [Thermoflavimicrobium dichotomicum]|uniref:Cell division protein FtsB n=1 Tax=Thermoflavimicrobium dichotomicum TaxID=46223 RepID=A0A1I3QR72_9BACL|nr:septum formation initiator family protein [Thermoflavimicrobium dichotomicum]SFJ35781.1 Cell division protein FtsB [Thermoflavimicrobium dichotomicum]